MFGYIIDLLVSVKNRTPRAVKEKIGYFLILPSIAAIGLMVSGFVYLLYLSFQKRDIFRLFVPELTFENYFQVFISQGSASAFFRTFYISIIVSALCAMLSIPYAYYIVRTRSGFIQKMLIFFTLVPFFTGDVIKSYGWLVVLGKNGMLSWLTETFFNFRLDIINTPISVSIGLLQITLPLSTLIIAPAIASVNRELEMAAQNLGASPIKTFFTVVFPLLKPGILGAFLTAFTISVTEYAAPDLLGGGINDFVANFVYMIMFNAINYPFAAATSITLTLLSSVVVYVILKTGRIGNIFIRGRS